MNKSIEWRLTWNNDLARYQLCKQTGQYTVVSEVDAGCEAWQDWLELVSSFAFQSKDGHSFTALKERRTCGKIYWTANRKANGKLTRKYLGVPQEVTLTRLEEIAVALTASMAQVAPSSPCLEPLIIPSDSDAMGMPVPEQAQEQLVATKFFVPASSHALIPRPHLDRLIHEGMQRQLILVSAPAGFGKTTSVANWVRSLSQGTPENHENYRVAWVSLDDADGSAVRFWTCVFTALDKSEPGVATAALQLMQAPNMPALEEVLTTFINGLSQVAHSYVLILDDLHLVNDLVVQTTLRYLVEHQPPQLHLMMLTRLDPPLNLPRLRARGQLFEIRTDQLRCTTEEATAFLREIMGIELAPEALLETTNRTEGWLVGLQLLGLSLQGRSDPNDLLPFLNGTHHYILDYLTEEVLRQQPTAVQQFLLRTSFLEGLTASLCDAVVEQTGSQRVLEYLERANLFLKPLDEQRRWYCYHGLFAEALRARIERENGDAVPALHLRASHWFAEKGLMVEAVHHALQAKDWRRAADLIETCTQTLSWRQDEVPMFMRWLEFLPTEIVRSRPRLSLFYTEILLIAGQLKAIEPWLQAAEAVLAKGSSVESMDPALPVLTECEQEVMLGEIAALRAIVADYYGDSEAVLHLCQLALAHLSEQDAFQQATIAAVQGLRELTSGKTVTAMQRMREASAIRQEAGSIGGAIHYLNLTGSCLQMQGHLHEAWQTFQQAITLGTEPTGSPSVVVGGTYTYQADVLREWNQLDAALDLVLQGLRFAEEAGYTMDVDRGYMVLVRIYLSRGEVKAADAALKQVIQLPTMVDNQYRRSWLTAVEQVRVFLVREELERATHWIENLTRRELLASPFAREREDTARVRVLLALHQPGEALTLLEPLIAGATTAGRFDHVIEMRLLQALAHQMCHDEREALSALARAVRLAEPEGYIRRFVDEGPAMAALLSRWRDQLRRHGPTPYLDTVLTAFPQKGAGAKPLAQHGLLDPLSERELEVLRELAHGASNQEIADTLILAVATVKRHVGNILGKLGANNRTQAVALARGLGLLSDEHEERQLVISGKKN